MTHRNAPLKPQSTVRRISRAVTALVTLSAALLIGPSVWAKDPYPSRPITVISPFSAGGDADIAARNFAAAAQRALNQTVIVVNKTGASGIIGSAQVLAAPPDGYTLLLARTGSQAIMPAIMPTTTKYKWNDFTFLGTVEVNPYGCVVNAKTPYKTFADLVDAMRTKGKGMNYGTAGVLTTNDMGPRQLFKMLKLTEQTPTQIPYKGTGEATVSLLGGQTEFACGSLGTFLPQIKGGLLRALMVTTPARMESLPDVPTARELGYAEMEGIVGWSAVYGPPNLPADVRDKLVDTLKLIANDTAWRNATALTGSLPYVRSPEETRAFVEKQYLLYRALGESLNIIDSKAF